MEGGKPALRRHRDEIKILNERGEPLATSVSDVIGEEDIPVGYPNIRAYLKDKYPGMLLIELHDSDRDQGIIKVQVCVPAGLSCPEGTRANEWIQLFQNSVWIAPMNIGSDRGGFLPRLRSIGYRVGGSILLLMSGAALPSDTAGPEDVYLWFCDPRESSGILNIEVRVRGHLVDLSQVTYCKRNTRSRPTDEARSIRFYFFDTESVFSDKDTILTGDIWQAGAETDAVLLGVSFVSNGTILVNTLHPALLGEEFVSSPKEGLVIVTSAL